MTTNPETQSADGRPTTVFATLIGIAVGGIVLILIKWASAIIGPIMLGFFLAALGRPAYKWLQKRGYGSGWALLGVVLLLVVLGGVLLLLGYLYVDRLSTGLSTYREQLLSRFGLTGEMLDSAAAAGETSTGITLGGGMSTLLLAIVAALAGAISQIVIGFVLSIMLLMEWPRFGSIVRGVGNTQPFLAKMPIVANTAVTYFAVRAKINLMTGVVVTIALLLIGVDYAVLWGVVTFFLSFVPYVGIVVATAAPAILALAESGWWAFWFVIIAVIILNSTVEYVVAPTMTGKSLSLSPTIVFIMFFFWSWLLGPVGMLVSMPITVLLMLVFASDANTLFLARLLGSGGALEPLPESVEAAGVPAAIDE
jgi:predicted PurR-regulated permease PerM